MAGKERSQRQIAQAAISNRLRELGFAGSAPHYYMDLPDTWLVLTVDHGRGFAEPGESTFTGDFWTCSKAIMRVRGIDSTKRPKRAESHSQRRIGAFLTPQYDKWWTTADAMSDGERDEVVASFIDAVEEALPAVKLTATDAFLHDELVRIVAGRPAPHWTGLLRDLEKGTAGSD